MYKVLYCLVSHKSDFFDWILIVLCVNIIYYVDFYDNQNVTLK